jgi:hypothetical protein
MAAPARKVRRITLYLMEQNKYENELQQEQQRKMEEAERERERLARRSGHAR